MSDTNNHSAVVKKELPYHPIFPGKHYEDVEYSQTKVPTIPLLVFLIIVFYLLKKFIYIPDEKRDGK